MHRHHPPAPRARPGRTRNRPPADVARRPRRARPLAPGSASTRVPAASPPNPAAHARPQEGGGPAATGCPLCLRSTRTTALILEHRSGQYWVDETRDRFQASTPSPGASRAPPPCGTSRGAPERLAAHRAHRHGTTIKQTKFGQAGLPEAAAARIGHPAGLQRRSCANAQGNCRPSGHRLREGTRRPNP